MPNKQRNYTPNHMPKCAGMQWLFFNCCGETLTSPTQRTIVGGAGAGLAARPFPLYRSDRAAIRAN
jgi:hypothetical protein